VNEAWKQVGQRLAVAQIEAEFSADQRCGDATASKVNRLTFASADDFLDIVRARSRMISQSMRAASGKETETIAAGERERFRFAFDGEPTVTADDSAETCLLAPLDPESPGRG
jgi:hypothetical protein